MPLVTVTVPCFDAADTLPMALASLLAQTIDDWECVIVDDGSPQPVEPMVAQFDDRRFRIHTFDQNRGRPVARQKATEMARGDYICMLDADDWYYPDKLERQLEILRAHPDLVAVSSSVAVIDERDEIIGIRRFTDRQLRVHTGERHRPPLLVFAATMFRADVAMAAEFDPRLTRAEDPDYLMQLLGGRRYALTADIHYAYRERYCPQAIREALEAFRCQRTTFADRFGDAPLQFGAQYAWNLVKTGIYATALATGTGRWLFERRNEPANSHHQRQFRRQRRVVEEKLGEYV